MKYIVQLICFALFVLMACSDEGGPASHEAEGMARFSRLHEEVERFVKNHASGQFSSLSPGFTFENHASCGTGASLDVNANPGTTEHFDLAYGECFEGGPWGPDGSQSFVIFNSAPLDDDFILIVFLVFYDGRPESRDYNLNCMTTDCDNVSLMIQIIDHEGQEAIHYHGVPDVLTVAESASSVIASFNGMFYSDFEEDEAFSAAGTVVCCETL